VTLESASITEMGVSLGLDWVVVDVEHGHLDYREILDHVRATVRSDTVILVRVLSCDQGIIKRVLDIGADGFLVPWVETADQLRDAVSFARYPLEGVRGIGGERATCWGQCLPEHVKEANENVLVIPIIESVKGVSNLSQMLAVDGVDVFFFGPSDYSSSAGYAGAWEGPGVAETIQAAKDKILAAGKQCGVIATGVGNLQERLEEGFRMIAVGLDGGLMIRGIRRALAAMGKDRGIATTLDPDDSPIIEAKPARTDVNSPMELGAGVTFERQLGPADGVREVTAGVMSVAPDASLPYHTANFTESLTLVQGSAIVEVEGRMYTLAPLDAVTIPEGLARGVTNRSSSEAAVFHVTMTTGDPRRSKVDKFFPRKAMGIGATGQPERSKRLG
jgi:2-dehydro-3-deoxyglucarate aldolase/4-hydroxy-2-oxoheptanedioate aldolase